MLGGMNRDLPIPLRPDPSALRRDALGSLFRAAVVAGKRALGDQTARSGDPDAQLILKAATTPTALADTPALTVLGTAFLASLAPGDDLPGVQNHASLQICPSRRNSPAAAATVAGVVLRLPA